MLRVTQNKITTRPKSSTRSEASTTSVDSLEGFETTVVEYASSSSAHGVGYIFESGRWGIERFLWILIVGFAVIFRHVLLDLYHSSVFIYLSASSIYEHFQIVFT